MKNKGTGKNTDERMRRVSVVEEPQAQVEDVENHQILDPRTQDDDPERSFDHEEDLNSDSYYCFISEDDSRPDSD